MSDVIELKLENIKCKGCAHLIDTALMKEEEIENVEIDIQSGVVKIFHDVNFLIDPIKDKLSKLGYPEMGTATTMQRAKSYVSCMIGRISS